MNKLNHRIYLSEIKSKAKSVTQRKFIIRDCLDNKKIGCIYLDSNYLEKIKIKPKSRHRYVATEALFLLIKKIQHDICCDIKLENKYAIKLFSTFASQQASDHFIAFKLHYSNIKLMTWYELFSNKLKTINLISNNHPKHALICPSIRIKKVGKDMFNRSCFLHPKALKAWQTMSKKAKQDGVNLQIISAYRSLEYQNQLILNKLNKGLLLDEIIKVNTLAGFSEHHSGCAIDIGSVDAAILEPEFETSEAFAWLTNNAHRFHFTLSYPRNNNSGIIYEPWHWCYINPAT